MIIEQAQASDLEAMMEVFKTCRATMLENGLNQWDETYPVATQVAEDILRSEVFVLRDEQGIAATITLNTQQDEQYHQIAWRYTADRILVIHRLAVHPRLQGQGWAKHLCLFAEKYGLENGYSLIRLDAYSDNLYSNRLYQKLNYHRSDGLCYFHGNTSPFFCYEKELKS